MANPNWITCPYCGRGRPKVVIVDGKCDYDRTEAERLVATVAFMRRQNDVSWQGPEGDAVRQERNQRLDGCLWAVQPGTPLTPECQAEFTEYRKALNRVTVDFSIPAEVVWPDQPTLVYE